MIDHDFGDDLNDAGSFIVTFAVWVGVAAVLLLFGAVAFLTVAELARGIDPAAAFLLQVLAALGAMSATAGLLFGIYRLGGGGR